DGIRDRNVTGVQTCDLPIFTGESGKTGRRLYDGSRITSGLRVIVKSEKRTAGRPVTPVLSRELIGEQALELVTARGLEQLTMTNLAKRLKVAASALYNHVANKADVVLLIQDALVSQVSLAGMQRLIDHQ